MNGQAIDYAINKIANGGITYELACKMLDVLDPNYNISKFLRKIVGKETNHQTLCYNVALDFVDSGLLDKPSDDDGGKHFKELASELFAKQKETPTGLKGLIRQIACL